MPAVKNKDDAKNRMRGVVDQVNKYYGTKPISKIVGDQIDNSSEEFDKILQSFLGADTSAETSQRINAMNQDLLSNQRRSVMNSLMGGGLDRTQFGPRGTMDLGGMNAIASSMGRAQIMKAGFDRQFQQQVAGLQAYVQKYGIDKNVELQKERLKNARKAAEGDLFADFFQYGAQALMFLL